MANLGEIVEIVNAKELTLEIASGSGVYILLKNLVINVARTEARDVTTDGGPLYTYGAGDNWFTATLTAGVQELLDTNSVGFNKLTQTDASGAMTSRAWVIKGTQINGSDTVSWACTGYLRDYTVKKDPEGKVKIDIFVRIIGDTVAVT